MRRPRGATRALAALVALACLAGGAWGQAMQRECGWYSAAAARTCRRLRLRTARCRRSRAPCTPCTACPAAGMRYEGPAAAGGLGLRSRARAGSAGAVGRRLTPPRWYGRPPTCRSHHRERQHGLPLLL